MNLNDIVGVICVILMPLMVAILVLALRHPAYREAMWDAEDQWKARKAEPKRHKEQAAGIFRMTDGEIIVKAKRSARVQPHRRRRGAATAYLWAFRQTRRHRRRLHHR